MRLGINVSALIWAIPFSKGRPLPSLSLSVKAWTVSIALAVSFTDIFWQGPVCQRAIFRQAADNPNRAR